MYRIIFLCTIVLGLFSQHAFSQAHFRNDQGKMLMRVEDAENGLVGIGTTGMPISALHVRGKSNGITASVEGADINNYVLKLQSNTAGTVQEVLYASARGEIAIGHTQPENKLHIHGSIRVSPVDPDFGPAGADLIIGNNLSMLGIQAKQPIAGGGEEKAILRINAEGGRVIVGNNGPLPTWTGEGHSPFGLYSTNGVVAGGPGILFRDQSDPDWGDGVRLYLESSVSGATVTYTLKAVARTNNSDKGTATVIHTWTGTR